jgi:TRAP transporter TAXI family solute receptor
MKTLPLKYLPAIAALLLALILVAGMSWSLSKTQTLYIASGKPGGGYYELGEKLEQILRADFEQQAMEAPIAFEHIDSKGPQENLTLLAHRQAQLGLVLEGLSVKAKESGTADLRGLIKLTSSNLHLIAGPHLSRAIGTPISKLADVVESVPGKLHRPLRVFMGSSNGSTHAVMSHILTYYKTTTGADLGWEIVTEGSYADAVQDFLAGRIDLMCLLVATGSPTVVQMSQHGVLLTLPDALIAAVHMLHPALTVHTIPAGVYNKDFPKTPVATLGAEDILVANAEVSNRLAYRIVRTLAIHWPELQTGVLLPEDFAQAQLKQNDYFPLHPGAVAFYKGENVPLWPWFENKLTVIIEHREVSLSILGGIPTVYGLLYAWYQRRRVTQLMGQIAAMRQQGAVDHAAIENVRMHALTLMAQGKLSRESYTSLNEFIEAQLKQTSSRPSDEQRPHQGLRHEPPTPQRT